MREGWRKVRLDDVAELSGGYAFKSTQYANKGRFVLRTVNIRDDFSITREGATFISENEASEYSRFSLRDKDTLFVMVAATLGKVGYVRPDVLPALLNQNMWLIRARTGKIEPDFLHFCFRELSKIPLAWVSGSARSFLRRDDVRNIEFFLPTLPEQRAIADTLNALDDKIELNRRMNETLEAMARAVFKDWFVDFGPTRAKMEGRPPYLAPELWSLFPDRLDAEGKPEGWNFKSLSEVSSELRRGVSPKYLETGGVRVLNQKCIRNNRVSFDAARRHDESAKRVDDRILVPGDILINSTGVGTLGRVGQIWSVDEKTIADSHVTVVRAAPTKISPTYLGINIISRSAEIEAMGEGSTGQTELSRARLSGLEILMPDKKCLLEFENIARGMIQKISANEQESQTLAATRDLLLPKLMSGEIRVRDAERLVEDAT